MSRRQSPVAVSFARGVALALAALALATLAPRITRADGRGFHHEAMKVRAFEPPIGWELQPTGSYARLLALWTDKDGDRLTLVAARVAATMTARALADESRPALLRQGFKTIVETSDKALLGDLPRLRLDAQLDEGRKLARQLYVVSDGIGYVITMIGPMTRAPQLRRDFDEAVLTLELGVEPRAPDAPVDVNR
jgi:hypothetical protein